MRILIDLVHPAHVHLFKSMILELRNSGEEVTVIARNRDIVTELLKLLGIKFIVLGGKNKNFLGKIIEQITVFFQMLKIINSRNIEVLLGTSAVIPFAGFISRRKSFFFDDDDNEVQPLVVLFCYPFLYRIVSPSCIHRNKYQYKTIHYNGTKELAYLGEPFKPDPDIYEYLEIQESDPYFIIRLNDFTAHHDVGHHGISDNQLEILVNILDKFGKVFISTDRNIPTKFKKYSIKPNPLSMHSILYFAKVYVGDSQTMLQEAAILGTPAFKCNTFAGKLSVPTFLEKKYGLCHSYLPSQFENLINNLESVLNNDYKREWAQKRKSLISDSDNVPLFFKELIFKRPKKIYV